MFIYALAFALGIVTGLRTFMPLAALSWAARLGLLKVGGTSLAFLGYAATPWIASFLAFGELIGDQHPKTPSRKSPPQFIARVASGAFSGAAVGLAYHGLVGCIVCGVVGAVIGTLGGAAARTALARAFGKDLPAALVEDVVAIAGAAVIVSQLP
ncbi:MAG: DUF4126 family protein [Polyangia bacterium]